MMRYLPPFILLCLLSCSALLRTRLPQVGLPSAAGSARPVSGPGPHAEAPRQQSLKLPRSFYLPPNGTGGARARAAAPTSKAAQSIRGVDRLKMEPLLQAISSLVRAGRYADVADYFKSELCAEGGERRPGGATAVTSAEVNYLATKAIHFLGGQGADEAAAAVFAALRSHHLAEVDTFTLSAMMTAYTRARRFNRAVLLFEETTAARGVAFDIHTYNGYLQSAGSARDFAFILQGLQRAHDLFGKGCVSCVDTALTNLKFAERGSESAVERAHELVEWLRTRGVAPSERTLDILLNVVCSHCGSDLSQVERALAAMEEHGASPSRYTFNTLLNKCAATGDARGAARLVELMTQWGMAIDSVTYNTLLKLFIAKGDSPRAHAVLRSMRSDSVEPTDFTRSLLIQLNTISPPESRADVLDLLSGDEGEGAATPHMFAVAIGGCADYRAALRMLQRAIGARKADVAVYTAAAQACGKSGEYESAFRVLDIMVGRGIEMNKYSLSLALTLSLESPQSSVKRLGRYLGLAKSSDPTLLRRSVCQRVMARLTASGAGLAACSLHLELLAHTTCKTEVLEQLFTNMQLESAAGAAEESEDIAQKALALLGMYALGADSRHLLRTEHFNSVLRLLSLAGMYAHARELFKLMAGDNEGADLSLAWTWRPFTFTVAELVRCSKEAADPVFTAGVVSWACRCGTFVPEGVVSDAVSFAYGTGRTDLARDMYEQLYRAGSVNHWKEREELQMDLHAFSRGMAFAAISRRRRAGNVLTVITGKSTSRLNAPEGYVVSEEVQRVLTEDFFPPIDSSTVPGNSGRLTIQL